MSWALRSRSWRWWGTLAAATGAVAYLIFGKHPALGESIATARRLPASALALGVAFSLAQNLAQASRLWSVLPDRSRLPWLEVVAAVSWGQLTNVYAPARAGDVLKVGLVREIPAPDGPRDGVSVAGAVLVADKIVDVASLLLLLAIVTPGSLRSLRVPRLDAPVAVAVLVVAAGVCWGLARFTSLRHGALRFARGARGLVRPTQLLPALAFGAAPWCCEAVTLMVLARGAMVPLSFAQGLAVLVALNLAVAIPVLPANLVAFEGGVALGLARFGVPTAPALAIGALHHAIQVGSLATLAIALVFVGRLRRSARVAASIPTDRQPSVAAIPTAPSTSSAAPRTD